MLRLPRPVLPKRFPGGPHHTSAALHVFPLLRESAGLESAVVLQNLRTTNQGLAEAEAQRRLLEYGPNVVAGDELHPRLHLLIKACVNPLVILLLVLAAFSLLTGDRQAAALMMLMVVLGVALRFVQEVRANTAAAKLRAMISVKATVLRHGQPREEPIANLVPGDVVHLSAGDIIPADVRLLSCKDPFVMQAALTGEAFPHIEPGATRPSAR
jgi:P-type Mg2+ transporter